MPNNKAALKNPSARQFTIIPAIDLKDGCCVRLRQGQMEQSSVFSKDPVQTARGWFNKNCNHLHLVDLNGAFAGQPVHAEVVQKIRQALPDMTIQIGGGIRSMETIEAYISAGVNFVIIGTQAVKDPSFVKQACEKYPGKIIVGLDARGDKVATDGWAKTSNADLISTAQLFEKQGVSAIIYTDISRDGMLEGVNLEATEALAKSVSMPVIASGGIANIADIKAIKAIESSGVIGAIAGRSIYEGTLDLNEVHEYLDSH